MTKLDFSTFSDNLTLKIIKKQNVFGSMENISYIDQG